MKAAGDMGMRIRKISLTLLITIVSVLVLTAIVSNLNRFKSSDTVKYQSIVISEYQSFDDIALDYSDYKSKDKFISEVKKINNIENIENITDKTLMIPIISFE